MRFVERRVGGRPAAARVERQPVHRLARVYERLGYRRTGATRELHDHSETVELEFVGQQAMIRLILNVLWLVLSGFWLAMGYVLAGMLMCVLIITIPFGIASFRLAAYVLWPFGRTVVPRRGAGAASSSAT